VVRPCLCGKVHLACVTYLHVCVTYLPSSGSPLATSIYLDHSVRDEHFDGPYLRHYCTAPLCQKSISHTHLMMFVGSCPSSWDLQGCCRRTGQSSYEKLLLGCPCYCFILLYIRHLRDVTCVHLPKHIQAQGNAVVCDAMMLCRNVC
jgi:hypothetical protein